MPRAEPGAGGEVEATGAASSRPFYVILTLWGARFRYYFLEYCLPSLLSAGNIPALAGKRPVKLVIATLPQDWETMKATPIFKLLERYAEPVFVEIPPCPPDRSGCQHMGIGHKLMSEMAYRDKAYAVMITPDLMLSDGTVAKLHEHAANGVEIVLVAALRFGEEPFLANLVNAGIITTESRRDSGKPLALPARAMVAAAINGFHSETLYYEWDAPHLPNIPAACWWRVPGQNGIVIHCLSWAPLLLDYGVVKDHDVSALETWTIDGNYVHANFADSHEIRVVQDSDEMFIGSWAPLEDKPLDLTPSPLFKRRFVGEMTKGALLRSAFFSEIFDPLKREIFFLPVRWHSLPLNRDWAAVEKSARRKMLRVLGVTKHNPGEGFRLVAADVPSLRADPGALLSRDILLVKQEMFLVRVQNWFDDANLKLWALGERTGWALIKFAASISATIYRVGAIIHVCWVSRSMIARRLGQLARGDMYALRRIVWRIKIVALQIVGRFPRLPEPPIPGAPGAYGLRNRIRISRDSWHDNRDRIRLRLNQALHGDLRAIRRIVARGFYTLRWWIGRVPKELPPLPDSQAALSGPVAGDRTR